VRNLQNSSLQPEPDASDYATVSRKSPPLEKRREQKVDAVVHITNVSGPTCHIRSIILSKRQTENAECKVKQFQNKTGPLAPESEPAKPK